MWSDAQDTIAHAQQAVQNLRGQIAALQQQVNGGIRQACLEAIGRVQQDLGTKQNAEVINHVNDLQNLAGGMINHTCSICQFPGHAQSHCWLYGQMWQETRSNAQLAHAWWMSKQETKFNRQDRQSQLKLE